MRRMFAETRLSVDDLVAPLFVRDGIDQPVPIGAIPGHVQHTVDSLVAKAKRLADLGVPALILFGVPDPSQKNGTGTQADDPDGIAQRALRALRETVDERMVLIADLCLDEYTDHGHCGILNAKGEVDNDVTLERYTSVALAQAQAGADIVAPSGMMDGQVAAIRGALDAHNHHDTAVMAYAAKFASSLYGPFREAVGVQIAAGGDRRSYQQDPGNAREAMEEVALDVEEGADVVMVKPAITNLDVLAEVRRRHDIPVAAYQVSGEYALIEAAAAQGWVDGEAVALEQLTAIKRAGADLILTYYAARVAELLGARE
jgi:porphobilinogen synthase